MIDRDFIELLDEEFSAKINYATLGFSKGGKLDLGGIAGEDGGTGSPLAGTAGKLSQRYVCYDTTEAETLTTSGDPSLLDNLNHIRYRVATLESGISTTFLELLDTPSSYTGNSGKAIIVNSSEDGVEFGSGLPTPSTEGSILSSNSLNEWQINPSLRIKDSYIYTPTGSVSMDVRPASINVGDTVGRSRVEGLQTLGGGALAAGSTEIVDNRSIRGSVLYAENLQTSVGYEVDTFGVYAKAKDTGQSRRNVIIYPEGLDTYYGGIHVESEINGIFVPPTYSTGQATRNVKNIRSLIKGETEVPMGNFSHVYAEPLELTTVSGTVVNYHGFCMEDDASGQITNKYGIKIGDLTGATNNYSVYTGTADSYFGGAVGVRTLPEDDYAFSVYGKEAAGQPIAKIFNYYGGLTISHPPLIGTLIKSFGKDDPYRPLAFLTRDVLGDSWGYVYFREGSVGIGEAVPQAPLHIVGPSGALTMLRLETRDTQGSSSGNYFDVFVSASASSVRSQLSTFAGYNLNSLLDLDPLVYDETSSSTLRFFRSVTTTGTKTVQFFKGDGTTTLHAKIGVDGENSFFAVGGGKVGLGTNSPLYGLLEIKSTANDPNTGLTLYDGTNLASRMWLGNNSLFHITRGSDTTKGVTIDEDGNFGVGTASPVTSLHIKVKDAAGSIPSSPGIAFGSASSTALPGMWVLSDRTDYGFYSTLESDAIGGGFSASAYFFNARASGAGSLTSGNLFQIANNGSVKFTLDYSGNAGFGTTSPLRPLTVSDEGYLQMWENVSGTSNSKRLSLYQGNTSSIYRWVATNDDGSYKLDTLSMDLTTGNVGIKTSDPNYTLTVKGNIGFSPSKVVTPSDMGDVVFEFTNNTTLTVKGKGTDGVVRSGTITLA